MTRREAWLSAGFVFAVALAVRAVFAARVPFPTPEDPAYYWGVARNVLEGRGLVSDAIWSYQTPPLVFPRPAFEVWLPLPTLLSLVPMAVLGTAFHASQVPPVLVGALVPVLAWRLAADVAVEKDLPDGRRRTLAIGSGLTAAVLLPLVLFSALPDSTMPFAALSLVACLLMARTLTRPPEGEGGWAWRDPRLVGLGLTLGLAALTRNEAAWLALTWAWLAWRTGRGGEGDPTGGGGRARRLGLIGVPAILAALVFAPWVVRDWLVFGSPFPGQAVANALSVSGIDIFAWNDPPTLARYLAVGPARLVELRLIGLWHNLVSVLIVPGFPVALIGLVSLPWLGRARALRPLLAASVLTFLVASLVFPVSTTWGTFLHAAGAIQVLFIVVTLLALDAAIVRIGRLRGWTRPVAWLAPTLTISMAALFSLGLPSYADQAEHVERSYRVLAGRMAAIGHPLDETAGPVIADHPIWVAEALRVRTLALPDEPPADVLDLAAAFPGTRYLLLSSEAHGRWPAVLASGDPGAACFRELDLGVPANSPDAAVLGRTRVFQIGCS